MKTIWLDTETLSVDYDKPDIFQLAGFIEIDGVIKEKFNFFFRPDIDFDEVSEDIWEFHANTTGTTREDIEGFELSSKEALSKFISILDKYVDRYDKNDKFVIGGYNVQFDISKITTWAKHHGFKYLFAYLGNRKYDPFYIIPFALAGIEFPSLKLECVWKILNEDCGLSYPDKIRSAMRANHDARTDILQTYVIWKYLLKPIQEAIIGELSA